MTRLVDPLFVDRSLQGYRLAAGLALAGIALAFALTAGLARTVRRQAAERDRLQTELRRSERLAALGKLLAGVAHEVRNPLAGIRSTAQLWQRGVVGLDDESLGGLVHEVDRLEEIVSRLLQFSRADAQDLAPGDLNAVVAEAARLARGGPPSRRVQLEVDLDPDLPPVAMAPPALLQVFRNLTTNAIQAMSRGGTLRLSTRRDPARRDAITASVADTGRGSRAEALSHLFEPFFTTKAEGTGLGLAIAREIALAHRGDLRAANRAGRPGAVFTLTLPPSFAPTQRRTHDECQATPATILVADDDRTIRRNLACCSKAEGYRRDRGRRRRRGPGPRSKQDQPDAVLLDLKMPGRDGLEVLAELGPALADLPVIVVTAFGGSAAAIEAMRRGAYDYLTKPFDLDEVHADPQAGVAAACPGVRGQGARGPGRRQNDRAADEPDDAEPELDRPERRDARGLQGDRPRRRDRRRRLIVGESGTGKELVAAALAPPLGSRRRPVHPGQLRGAARGPGRERAVRPRARRLHRRRPPEARPVRARRRRHDLPRRGRRAAPRRPRPRSSASFSSGSSSASAGPRPSAPTPASSRPRTATCPGRSPPAGSARTCTTASTSPGSSSRRSATAPRTSRPWPSTSCERVERRHGWGELSLSPEALRSIRERPWPGNVRQLENTLARAVDRRAGPDHPARTPRRRRAARPGDPRGRRPRRVAAAPRPAGRGRAAGDPARLAGLRRQPHQDRRTPRHQPPPALRQDPRVRPCTVSRTGRKSVCQDARSQ